MNAQSGVIVAVTILDDHVVTDLKADPVAVVVPGFHLADREAVAILEKDATRVVAVEIFVVLAVPVERKVLDDNVGRVFAGQKWK
jgi:hypothetical protein